MNINFRSIPIKRRQWEAGKWWRCYGRTKMDLPDQIYICQWKRKEEDQFGPRTPPSRGSPNQSPRPTGRGPGPILVVRRLPHGCNIPMPFFTLREMTLRQSFPFSLLLPEMWKATLGHEQSTHAQFANAKLQAPNEHADLSNATPAKNGFTPHALH